MATDARQITISDLRPEHWPEVARIYEKGIARKLGKLNGVWRDVLLLERRSPKIT